MGGREAGSRHKEPLGNRVTVGHKASAAVGPPGRDSADCTVTGSLWPWHCHQIGTLRLQPRGSGQLPAWLSIIAGGAKGPVLSLGHP